jgi:hypothetical protein
MNVHVQKNTSYDKPRQLIPQQYTTTNVDEHGKFFTKKTVANKSNVKISSAKNIKYSSSPINQIKNTSPVVISTH